MLFLEFNVNLDQKKTLSFPFNLSFRGFLGDATKGKTNEKRSSLQPVVKVTKF